MARSFLALPVLAAPVAADTAALMAQATDLANKALFAAQTNPIAAVAVALVVVGACTMLGGKKLERDASGGTGATFNSYADAGKMLSNKDSVLAREKVNDSMEEYSKLFSGKTGKMGDIHANAGSLTTEESIKQRQEGYRTMVNNFYDLVTDFYEYGWCQSFHFGPRWKGESFLESIKRAEYHLCARLGLQPGKKVLDVGCGVGGPMRNMAIFSGADFEGITINEYQVKIANKYCEQVGLGDRTHVTRGDFQNLPGFKDGQLWEGIDYAGMNWANKFDAAYAIEATCHSPDKLRCFSEVARCLKKGGKFAGYEWCVLPDAGYDKNDPKHVAIKEGIEVGNGLPTLATPEEVVEALEKAGFKVLDHYDANRGVHDAAQIPWYDTLNGNKVAAGGALKGAMSVSGFRMTGVGRKATHAMVTVLEFLRIAPKGTVHVSAMLNATALDLVAGGEREIFTPSYFFVAEKK